MKLLLQFQKVFTLCLTYAEIFTLHVETVVRQYFRFW